MIIAGIDPGFRGAVAFDSEGKIISSAFKKTPDGLLNVTGIQELTLLKEKVVVFL